MSTFQNWILATRPKTLVACLIPILCATALAFSASNSQLNFPFFMSIFAFLSTLFIQIGTNLVNDAIDFHKGADTAERLGPIRVSQSGLIAPKVVLKAGLMCFACAILFGIPLVSVGGWPIALIGIASIICAYCYTGGPYPIAYKGLGEVFVFLFFGFTAVSGTYFLYTHTIHTKAIILSLQIGALASVILAVNNYRDCMTDRKVNKMTLAARFGKKFARYEILFLYLMTYVLSVYWYFEYGFMMFLFSIITLPIAWLVINGVFKNEPSKSTNKYLGMSALTELLFGIFISLGFLYFTASAT